VTTVAVDALMKKCEDDYKLKSMDLYWEEEGWCGFDTWPVSSISKRMADQKHVDIAAEPEFVALTKSRSYWGYATLTLSIVCVVLIGMMVLGDTSAWTKKDGNFMDLDW